VSLPDYMRGSLHYMVHIESSAAWIARVPLRRHTPPLLRPNPSIQFHQRHQPGYALHHPFRCCPHDRHDGTDGLGPIPEIGLTFAHFIAEHTVALFEIAEDGITVLWTHEEAKQQMGGSGAAVSCNTVCF